MLLFQRSIDSLKKKLVAAQTTRTGSLVSELIGAEQPIGVEGRARFKVRSAGCASQACDAIFRQHVSKNWTLANVGPGVDVSTGSPHPLLSSG